MMDEFGIAITPRDITDQDGSIPDGLLVKQHDFKLSPGLSHVFTDTFVVTSAHRAGVAVFALCLADHLR